jgi:hypothetical protein
MDVKLLVVPDCPNELAAAELLRRALDDVGLHDTAFTTRVVTGQDQAGAIGFTGSPAFLVAGRDPFADSALVPGLACRVYWNEGGLADVHGLRELRRALMVAAESDVAQP